MATPKMQVLLADEFLRRLLQALITQTGVDGCSALAVAPEYFTFSFEGEDPIATPELIARIEEAVSELVGSPVKTMTARMPRYPADTFLVLPGFVHARLRALLAATDPGPGNAQP